jgi:ABC-type multidrug transport system ATPase subunit
MIEFKDLNFSFNKTTLIKDLTFNSKDSKVILVSGANGSGKTTLLKIFAGILEPNSGLVSIPQSWTRSYIPVRTNGLYARLTGAENIDVFSSFLGIDSKTRASKWCECQTFQKALNTPFYKCSIGMKQILNVFVLTLNSPRLILGDEIFKPFDIKTKNFVKDSLLNEFPDSTFIFATHEQMNWECETIEVTESMWS